MADNYVFNIAKGRAYTFWENVDTNNPATSGLIVVPLSATVVTATGQDYDDLAAFIGDAGVTDLTGTGGWTRATITDTELAATDYAIDDTNNRVDLAIPETSMGSPTSSSAVAIVIGYDDNTGTGTDANIIPLVHLDFSVTGDGSEVIINAGDVIRGL